MTRGASAKFGEQFEAGPAGHLHVEEDEVGGEGADFFLGLLGVGGFADDLDFRMRFEEAAQLGAGEAFVIDEECFHDLVAGRIRRASTQPGSGNAKIERCAFGKEEAKARAQIGETEAGGAGGGFCRAPVFCTETSRRSMHERDAELDDDSRRSRAKRRI